MLWWSILHNHEVLFGLKHNVDETKSGSHYFSLNSAYEWNEIEVENMFQKITINKKLRNFVILNGSKTM